jgi:hypothetical protein
VDNAWAGIIGAGIALAGVGVSSVAGLYRAKASFKREKTWAVRDERRQYLEELWARLDELQSGYNTLYQRAVRPHVWVSSSHESAVELPWARVRLVVALYLPEFQRVLLSLDSAGLDFDEALRAEPTPVPGLSRPSYEALVEASEQFDEAIEKVRARITDETRAITHARELSTSPPGAVRR